MKKKKKQSLDLRHLPADGIFEVAGALLGARCALARKGYALHIKKSPKSVNMGVKNCGAKG